MTIEDSIWFYEVQLSQEERKDCEERAVSDALEEFKINQDLDFYKLKMNYYFHNLVDMCNNPSDTWK